MLTQGNGLSEADQCYEDDTELESDSSNFPANWACRPERLGVRLPTEAEWEYACRAGTKTAFGFGSDPGLMGEYAWFEENSDLVPQPPGLLRPNLRGLFDMHGNVAEWCTDWYKDYPEDVDTDPTGGSADGRWKIYRGGSWITRRNICRSALRRWNTLQSRYTDVGVQVVRTLPLSSDVAKPPSRPQVAVGELRTLRDHTDSVKSVDFNPNGKILATGGNDGRIVFSRVEDGERLRILSLTVGVTCVCFSRDGMILASGNFQGDDQLCRVADGFLLRSIPDHGDEVDSLAFSPDGSMLAIGSNDRTVWLRRTADWQEIRRLKLKAPDDATPNSVAFSPDGTMLAAGYDDSDIRIWRIVDGELLKTLAECKKDINSISFSPDGSILAAGGDDHRIRSWRVADWKLANESVSSYGIIMSLAFSPDGSKIVTASTDKKVRLWAVADLNRLLTVRGHERQVNCADFSADGTVMASGGFDNTVKLWKLEPPSSATGPEPTANPPLRKPLVLGIGHASGTAGIRPSSRQTVIRSQRNDGPPGRAVSGSEPLTESPLGTRGKS